MNWKDFGRKEFWREAATDPASAWEKEANAAGQ